MNIGQGVIELDVHGCTWYQARAIIDSTLKRASKSTYRIRIIHGCNNGTRLRDMVRRRTLYLESCTDEEPSGYCRITELQNNKKREKAFGSLSFSYK